MDINKKRAEEKIVILTSLTIFSPDFLLLQPHLNFNLEISIHTKMVTCRSHFHIWINAVIYFAMSFEETRICFRLIFHMQLLHILT